MSYFAAGTIRDFSEQVGKGNLSNTFIDRADGKDKEAVHIWAQHDWHPWQSVGVVTLESSGKNINPLDRRQVAENIAYAMNGVPPKHALGMQLHDPVWIRKKNSLEIVLMNRVTPSDKHTVVVTMKDGLMPHLHDEVEDKLTSPDIVSRYMKTFEAPPYQPTVKVAPTIGGEKL